ncbi:MAG TPA: ATP-binding protein [Candidatus Acidoferrales bacterium]|nr:ATP-binding protein [Candidatus Acidoferrales bacterium]
MERFIRFINPIAHFGEKYYSYRFPVIVNVAVCIASEIFAYGIVRNPMIVGAYIIFLNVALIIYFSFRDSIRGGFTATAITIFYYLYIIYTRHYSGQQLSSGIITVIILGFIYILLAAVIGWLRLTIDNLIEREANEKARLHAVLQQLAVGVVITDSTGKVTQANRQLEHILGVKVPVGYRVGRDIALVSSLKNNKSLDVAQSPLYQALKKKKSVLGEELTLQRNDGKRVFIQVNSSVIVNKKKKIIAAASIINDVTQQKEQELRKDDFVNMASHELKTPITSMILYIDSLIWRVEKYNDEKSIRIVKNIKQQTEKLQQLVNDLLDVSRLQTGKLSFNKEKFSIDTLVEETIEGIQGGADQQRIIYNKQVPISVYADRFRIYQVITNLITNALKYSREEKNIKVQIKRNNGKVIVSVQDFGIGIAKEEQKKIFDRLYQVTDDRQKTFSGFGMGLYISQAIVKRHRGAIWVESEKEKGSTFYFSLPLQKKAI